MLPAPWTCIAQSHPITQLSTGLTINVSTLLVIGIVRAILFETVDDTREGLQTPFQRCVDWDRVASGAPDNHLPKFGLSEVNPNFQLDGIIASDYSDRRDEIKLRISACLLRTELEDQHANMECHHGKQFSKLTFGASVWNRFDATSGW
jgi:hypothetical protein